MINATLINTTTYVFSFISSENKFSTYCLLHFAFAYSGLAYTFLPTCCPSFRSAFRWRDALKWLELVRTHGAVPLDVFHFSAAIAACAKGRQWAHALFLLESMAKHGVEVSLKRHVGAC